eukprot:CAMPEP_0181209754 /NCGR_PEP_ID=MMETSP1096-20121128/22843_1 /TAXON_ID=156174 ORGANISM="Chrysochromulina ericina, Strain CCMP281" /NCGR_SAMPLE_ID=MMETSP1096 /ASSEMBLY_ACC=CAM_ASM_000453 /LENGTH=176 /DNA_ID=CAMNT_0023300953 /DNA_START=208 /DNA_END=739 /DNA_ORIENTATION=-
MNWTRQLITVFNGMHIELTTLTHRRQRDWLLGQGSYDPSSAAPGLHLKLMHWPLRTRLTLTCNLRMTHELIHQATSTTEHTTLPPHCTTRRFTEAERESSPTVLSAIAWRPFAHALAPSAASTKCCVTMLKIELHRRDEEQRIELLLHAHVLHLLLRERAARLNFLQRSADRRLNV